MKLQVTQYLKRHSPSLLAMVLLSCDLASGETLSVAHQNILWSAPDRGLVLYFESEAGSRRVCPQILEKVDQPFCRTFEAEVLSVCGSPEELQLVLSNGEIFLLNHALLGTGGSFEPTHRPAHALDLIDAWMPEGVCEPGAELNQILAVASGGGLWHFSENHWRQIAN
jgi:hypothetical protein